MILNEEQIALIESTLVKSNVFNSAVRAELLDHISCLVEMEMCNQKSL